MSHSCRSILFFPALRPERWREALDSGADIVVFDLEDGTARDRKAEARAACLPLFAGPVTTAPPRRFLRINSPRDPEGLKDILALRDLSTPPDGLIVPKVESPEELTAIMGWLADVHTAIDLVALIETPRGLRMATEIAKAKGPNPGPDLVALFLGTADFSAEIGSDLSWDALAHARGAVVCATREAGIAAIDGVFFDPHDSTGLQEEALRVAAMGFSGKASYDATQIPAIHAAFTPSAETVAWARRVLEVAAADQLGTARLDGRMINESIARKARDILRGIGEQ